jgi:hypothetical protein
VMRSAGSEFVQDRLEARRSFAFKTRRCRVFRWAVRTSSDATLWTSRACSRRRSSRSASALRRATVSSSLVMGGISSQPLMSNRQRPGAGRSSTISPRILAGCTRPTRGASSDRQTITASPI